MDNAPRHAGENPDLIEYVRFDKTAGRNETKKFPRGEDRQRRSEGWKPLNENDITGQTTDDR